MESAGMLDNDRLKEIRKRLIARSAMLVLLIFFVNYAAMTFFWYFSIWWFDMPMHFLGGLWLGITAFWAYISVRKPQAHPSVARSVTFILFTVLIVGVGWEIFEVVKDHLILVVPFNALDTASDLFFDLAGGAIAALSLFRRGYMR